MNLSSIVDIQIPNIIFCQTSLLWASRAPYSEFPECLTLNPQTKPKEHPTLLPQTASKEHPTLFPNCPRQQ